MRVAQRILPPAVTLIVAACASAPPRPAPAAAPAPAVTTSPQAPPVTPSRQPTAAAPAREEPQRPSPPSTFDAPDVRVTRDGTRISPAIPRAPLPIPSVDGPLAIHVVYPPREYLVPARDSNFLLGSVGSGLASLTINGHDVKVEPNGAFLAWLPVPPRDAPRYEIRATKPGGESAQAELVVRRPAPPMPLPDTGRLVVDRASVQPTGALRLRPGEFVHVAIRIPSNAHATLAGDTAVPLTPAATNGGVHTADVRAATLAKANRIVVRRGRDSLSVPIASVTLVDSLAPRFVELLNDNVDAKADTDEVVILRPTPGGTYKWFLHPHTVVEATGQRGPWVRVRLADDLEAWLDSSHVRAAARTMPVRRIASNARVVAGPQWTDVRIPMSERAPFLVDETADALVVTLYGTLSDIDIVNFSSDDPVVRDVQWEQASSDRVRVTVRLRRPPFGHLALWDRGAFVLRVRRPPDVADPARPLAGRVIALDPGHPPIGSTGPTGLYEGDVTLAVAEALKPMLEAEGATVVMTRTTRGPVALGERPITARRANAEVFVSIHLNALPDGVNPARVNGTGTYYFHPRAASLARDVQRGLVRWMGLRDLGVNYDNLAVARATWMPSILCEGAFVIVPDQEAALRTSEFQSRYAIGILEGLERYFREIGNPR